MTTTVYRIRPLCGRSPAAARGAGSSGVGAASAARRGGVAQAIQVGTLGNFSWKGKRRRRAGTSGAILGDLSWEHSPADAAVEYTIAPDHPFSWPTAQLRAWPTARLTSS